jgi:hypothetical protein
VRQKPRVYTLSITQIEDGWYTAKVAERPDIEAHGDCQDAAIDHVLHLLDLSHSCGKRREPFLFTVSDVAVEEFGPRLEQEGE